MEPEPNRHGDRPFDLVLWGATGFTGRLVAEHLEEHYRGMDLHWALVARDLGKLEALRDRLGTPDRPVLVADAFDAQAMIELARSARVVCTTVGPYARYGDALVAACAAESTDLCDISGELAWMRRMERQHGAAAERSGARIVHACGFDSVPSDLGVWFVQREARRRFGAPSAVVKGTLASASGGISGGTVASAFEALDDGEGAALVRRAWVLRSPPRSGDDAPDARARLVPHYDRDLQTWTAPFPGAIINVDVVRRSAERVPDLYGRGFRYEESVETGRGPLGAAKAYAGALGLVGAAGLLSLRPVRKTLRRRLPQPGEGPGKRAREEGHWTFRFVARAPAGSLAAPVRARVSGDRDPGYGSTARMLAEAAVCLARDTRGGTGGFVTPAAAMGGALVGRLERSAGLTFRLES